MFKNFILISIYFFCNLRNISFILDFVRLVFIAFLLLRAKGKDSTKEETTGPWAKPPDVFKININISDIGVPLKMVTAEVPILVSSSTSMLLWLGGGASNPSCPQGEGR